jgi:hypothetical protein
LIAALAAIIIILSAAISAANGAKNAANGIGTYGTFILNWQQGMPTAGKDGGKEIGGGLNDGIVGIVGGGMFNDIQDIMCLP